ncbi:MAG: hypothetical protein M3P91_09885 [Actinomycetota bacterium]|nr:hypothetical protein [Actinomycetota bacterium]
MKRNPPPHDDPSSARPSIPTPPDQTLTAALERDLAVVAWLETTQQQLSEACTDHILTALLDWSIAGQRWPEPMAPAAGQGCDHLDVLVQATHRLRQHALQGHSPARRYELAALVRGLALAIACQQDPTAVAEEQWRASVHRQPWRADAPAPIYLPDGRLL